MCVKEVGQRQVIIFESFGKIIYSNDEPGLMCYPRVCCVKDIRVDTAVLTMALKGSSVPDKSGSPLQVSAIMNYRVNDAIAFTYSVSAPH